MKPQITHAVCGDRVLLTLGVPRESISCADQPVVHVTLDDQDWRDAARRLLREQSHAQQGLDPDAQIRRVEASLRSAATQASYDHDPDVVRRRIVSATLHRLADMVLSGAVSAFGVDWEATALEAEVRTGEGEKRRSRLLVLNVGPADAASPNEDP